MPERRGLEDERAAGLVGQPPEGLPPVLVLQEPAGERRARLRAVGLGGEAPAALRQAEIDEIRARIEAASGKEVPKVQYGVGEEVKINDGAFASLTGRIDEIDPDRGKLKVSVSIFGRFTPVELEYWQVSRVTE